MSEAWSPHAFYNSHHRGILKIFRANEGAIRNFEGCTHLELLRDVNDETIYTTLSHWRDEESLERYRKSQLFLSVWSRVRALFSKRPEAFSLLRS